jgi:small subunit ribosomal protein S17
MSRIITGTVVSTKGDKTITVKVDRRITHPIYKKQYTRSKKYHAHDEENSAVTGDLVEITETRPISKTKRWNLSKVVKSVGDVK